MPLASNAKEKFNYDEDKVPKYTLPDPLTMNDGSKVSDAEAWGSQRRGEVLALFEEYMYGKTPDEKLSIRHKEIRRNENAFDGKVIQREIRVFFTDKDERPFMDILLHQPKSEKPVPVFVGLNFHGNYATTADTEVTLSDAWMRNSSKNHNVNHRATEKSRGTAASRWPACCSEAWVSSSRVSSLASAVSSPAVSMVFNTAEVSSAASPVTSVAKVASVLADSAAERRVK